MPVPSEMKKAVRFIVTRALAKIIEGFGEVSRNSEILLRDRANSAEAYELRTSFQCDFQRSNGSTDRFLNDPLSQERFSAIVALCRATTSGHCYLFCRARPPSRGPRRPSFQHNVESFPW